MKRDTRPVKEQVKSGFKIAGKLAAAFCVAATFLSGWGLIQESASSAQTIVGWLLIMFSIAVMTITVGVWLEGFVGFIAYAALRLFLGTLFATSLHLSPFYMLSVATSLSAMGMLCIPFALRKRRFTWADRALLVLAASCALFSLPLMGSYRSVAVLNVGNVALGLSWLAARASRQTSDMVHKTAAHD